MNPLEQWKAYREEDKHECNLLSTRINALLTSQSLFMATAAILYAQRPTPTAQLPHQLLLLVTGVALASTLVTGFAIWIGCLVLREWHNKAKKLRKHPDLKKLALKRDLPDWKHTFSMDVFGISLASIFAIVWGIVGWKLIS